MFAKISITCFLASYGVAFALEVSRLFFRSGVRGALMVGFGLAGLVAHTMYLAHRAMVSSSLPLSSEFDFYLVAAWTLAIAYLYLTIYHPHNPIGLFLLPVVMLFVALASLFANPAPFPSYEAATWWGLIHGVFWLAGTVAVTIGFITGLMYLLQAYRLKHKLPPGTLKLPSLEWLQRMNSRTLAIAVFTLTAGFLAGVMLNTIKRSQTGDPLALTDPVVLASSVLTGWVVLAWAFNLFYKPAQQGRKVAYLTVANFAFLLASLVALLLPTQHGAAAAALDHRPAARRVE
jgi:ABC-type transport system involved in cytochrome c biogenesis permease subunit